MSWVTSRSGIYKWYISIPVSSVGGIELEELRRSAFEKMKKKEKKKKMKKKEKKKKKKKKEKEIWKK